MGNSKAAANHQYVNDQLQIINRARSLVVSDLRSETKGSRFEFGCHLCAEVSFLQ